MSKDVFLGILSGMGEAHQEQNKNLLSQEVSRRKNLADFWKSHAENPDTRPEARDIATQKYMQIVQTPFEKKLPKEVEGLDDFLTVSPKLGQSVERPPTAQPPQAPIFDKGGVIQTVEPPVPPPFISQETLNQPSNRVPAQYTEQDRLNQARRAGQAGADVAEGNAYAQARGKARYEDSPEAIKAAGERAAAVRAPAPPPDFRGIATDQDIVNTGTGEVVRKGVPNAPTPDNNITEMELYMKAAGGDPKKALQMAQADKIAAIKANDKASGKDKEKLAPGELSGLAQMVISDNSILRGLSPTDKGKVYEELGKNKIALRTMARTFATRTIEVINRMAALAETDPASKSRSIGAKGLSSGFGLLPGMPMAGTSARDYAEMVESLKAMTLAPNLEMMRGLGQMSDRELGVVASSSSVLSRDLSEPSFDGEVARIKGSAERILAAMIGQEGPTPPPGAGIVTPTGNTATMADVEAYATTKRITVPQARKEFEASGFQVR